MSLERIRVRQRWILPFAAVMFGLLAIGAHFDALPWDRPITAWVVEARTPQIDNLALRISFLGSTRVVIAVAVAAAMVASRRCPRLAMAIVVIALARPLIEWGLKELVGRHRPVGHRLVAGRGASFPSGHPLGALASWGLVPLVVALYTKRRVVWWATAVGVSVLIVLVAASRVWLGVHWASDVIASLALAVLGIAAGLDNCQLVSMPYTGANTFWVFRCGEDVFVPVDHVLEIWESDRLTSAA